MIRLVNVYRSFEGITALDGLTLHVKEGSLVGVMGPGGGGKSTLCKVACGLIKPDRGLVFVDGTDLLKIDRRELIRVQATIGIQFQNDALFEHMTVLDNIAYPLKRLTDLGRSEIRARSIERLAMVGLSGFEPRMPAELSGGQRRRVALARACITDPKILICDDPTAGLDPVTSRRILDMIVGIRYQVGNTVMVVSSDTLGLMSISDRVALIWEGKVIAEGSPTQFWQDRRREVRRFLDDAKLPVEKMSWQ